MLRHKSFYLVILLGLIMFCWELGVPALRHREGIWAAIAQNMYARGDYFLMEIGMEDYYDKPFFSYWLIVVCAKIFGGVSEFTVRLPSALSAVLALAFTYSLAAHWFSQRVAVVASLILASSLGFTFWARHGQVEMGNLLGILLVIWIFFRYKANERPGWLYLMASVMAVTSWLKGPLCYMVPGFVMVCHSLLFRDWKWLRLGHVAGAGGVSLLLYFAPFVVAWGATGKWDALYMVYRENVVRFVDPFDHVMPFYSYFPYLALNMLPWSLFLPWLLGYLWQQRRTMPQELKQLLVVIVAIFVFFCLSGSRRSYYLIPMLPFTSILLAICFTALPDLGKLWQRTIAVVGLIVGVAAILPLPLLLTIGQPRAAQVLAYLAEAPVANMTPLLNLLFATGMFVIATMTAVVGVAIIAGLSVPTLRPTAVVGLPACACALFFLYFGPLTSQLEVMRSNRPFAREMAQIIPKDKVIAFFPKSDAALIFYLQIYRNLKDYQVFGNEDQKGEARAHMALLPSGGFLITDRGLNPALWSLVTEEKRFFLQKNQRDAWLLYRAK